MDVKLFHGDCLELMGSIQSMSVDLILVDPPYGTTQCKWDSCIDLELMWVQVKRVLKPSGVAVIMAQTPFDKVLGASNIKMLKHEWIWEKTNATGFLNANKMPLKAHENALVFYNKLPTYNPQFTHGHERKVSRRKDVNSECYGKALRLTDYDSTSRYPRSVLKFPSDKHGGNFHPTQKPLRLMEYFILTYSNAGDMVLDFTMGSGTTGVAAKRLNRNFIGIELDNSYFDIASKRILNTELVADKCA